MADGTVVLAGGEAPGRSMVRRQGGMRQFARRRWTIAFLLCLPLILLIATLVIYPAIYASTLPISRGREVRLGSRMPARRR